MLPTIYRALAVIAVNAMLAVTFASRPESLSAVV